MSHESETHGLAELMGALQELADAVTADDRTAYCAALQVAKQAGASRDQIKDAYHWRNGLRALHGRGWVSFDWYGEPRMRLV